MDDYEITGPVELFPPPGGWMHVVAPQYVSDELAPLADRGLIAVRALLGDIAWDTSLLPRGDGRHFVPLKAAVRDAHGIDVGDHVTLTVTPRER